VTGLLFKKSFHVFFVTLFSSLMGRLFDHLFLLMFIFKKVSEYSHVVQTFQPMTLTIPSEDIVATLH